MLNIALPKGRLGEKVYSMFEKAGYECPSIKETNRKLIFENKEKKLRFFWVKPSDVAIYVERGAADIGVVGKDTLLEEGKQVYEIVIPDKKDICWLTEMPKKHVREAIQARHYDLLIDLTQQSSITMQYMAMYIKAGLKTGRNIGKNIYDLSIDTPAKESPDYLYEQIVKYIQMFTRG